jgi:hypothetical protein
MTLSAAKLRAIVNLPSDPGSWLTLRPSWREKRASADFWSPILWRKR